MGFELWADSPWYIRLLVRVVWLVLMALVVVFGRASRAE